jgi:hypothetical protein
MNRPIRFLGASFILPVEKSDMKTTRFEAHEVRIIVGVASLERKRTNDFRLFF